MPITACVDGIPYSNDHLSCNLTAGGQAGLGQQITSFIACPATQILYIFNQFFKRQKVEFKNCTFQCI